MAEFNYNIFRRALYKIIRAIEFYLSHLVRKKKNLIVYYPVHFNSLTGDCIFLFDYILKNDSNIEQFILVNNKIEINYPQYQGYIVNRYSLRGIMLVLKAKFLVIDADGPFRKGKFSIIQLWHGAGFKNILALSGKYNLSFNKKRFTNICLVCATSKNDKIRKIKSFLTKEVFITGSPSNDFFFQEQTKHKIQDLKQNLKIDDSQRIFLYAPTYRKNSIINNLSDLFFEQLQNLAKDNNFMFLIKRHPKDKSYYSVDSFSNITDITDNATQLQELLLGTDLLITDYSSIATDFALLKRPIIFYTYDIDDYMETQRGFYYDLKRILPGPFANTEEELLCLIKELSWFEDSNYQNKFKGFQDMFHLYMDGDSSQRVHKYILKLMKVGGALR